MTCLDARGAWAELRMTCLAHRRYALRAHHCRGAPTAHPTAPTRRVRCERTTCQRCVSDARCRLSPVELDDIETRVAIDDVNEAALVHVHVVRLRRDFPCGRFGYEPAH